MENKQLNKYMKNLNKKIQHLEIEYRSLRYEQKWLEKNISEFNKKVQAHIEIIEAIEYEQDLIHMLNSLKISL